MGQALGVCGQAEGQRCRSQAGVAKKMHMREEPFQWQIYFKVYQDSR
jgi:hypothetical protein